MKDWQRQHPIALQSMRVAKNPNWVTAFSETIELAGKQYLVQVLANWADDCGNGVNTLRTKFRSQREGDATWHLDWCDLEELGYEMPAIYRELLKWDGCTSAGPWYYIENTVHIAGDRDANGLRKGEKRQIVNGRTGVPCWRLAAIDGEGNEVQLYSLNSSVDAVEQPACPYRMEYRPWCHVGEGKHRDLHTARMVAIWPEATDEELCSDNLEHLLQERFTDLLTQFRAVVERLGFVW